MERKIPACIFHATKCRNLIVEDLDMAKKKKP